MLTYNLILLLVTKVLGQALNSADYPLEKVIESVTEAEHKFQLMHDNIVIMIHSLSIKIVALANLVEGITPSVPSNTVLFFTLIFLALNLGLTTLPPIIDTVLPLVASTIKTHTTYFLMGVYALIFGAGGTCAYNLLDSLNGLTTWAMFGISFTWLGFSVVKSSFLLSVISNMQRPFDLNTVWEFVVFIFQKVWKKKGIIFNSIVSSHHFLFSLLSITLVPILAYFGNSVPDVLSVPQKNIIPRELPVNIPVNIPSNKGTTDVFLLLVACMVFIYVGTEMFALNTVALNSAPVAINNVADEIV